MFFFHELDGKSFRIVAGSEDYHISATITTHPDDSTRAPAKRAVHNGSVRYGESLSSILKRTMKRSWKFTIQYAIEDSFLSSTIDLDGAELEILREACWNGEHAHFNSLCENKLRST